MPAVTRRFESEKCLSKHIGVAAGALCVFNYLDIREWSLGPVSGKLAYVGDSVCCQLIDIAFFPQNDQSDDWSDGNERENYAQETD